MDEGLLLRFSAPDSDLNLIVDDDGRVAYAYRTRRMAEWLATGWHETRLVAGRTCGWAAGANGPRPQRVCLVRISRQEYLHSLGLRRDYDHCAIPGDVEEELTPCNLRNVPASKNFIVAPTHLSSCGVPDSSRAR